MFVSKSKKASQAITIEYSKLKSQDDSVLEAIERAYSDYGLGALLVHRAEGDYKLNH